MGSLPPARSSAATAHLRRIIRPVGRDDR
jgi:hypothetical protein